MKDNAPGFVYVLGCAEGYHKIGRCAVPSKRIQQLKIQLPFRVELLCMFFSWDAAETEFYLHNKFRSLRANGEWFRLSPAAIESLLKTEVLFSDLRLISGYKLFTQRGDFESAESVRRAWKTIPTHCIDFDENVAVPAGLL